MSISNPISDKRDTSTSETEITIFVASLEATGQQSAIGELAVGTGIIANAPAKTTRPVLQRHNATRMQTAWAENADVARALSVKDVRDAAPKASAK